MLILPLTSYKTPSIQSLSASVFSSVKEQYLTGLFGGLNEIMHVKLVCGISKHLCEHMKTMPFPFKNLLLIQVISTSYFLTKLSISHAGKIWEALWVDRANRSDFLILHFPFRASLSSSREL